MDLPETSNVSKKIEKETLSGSKESEDFSQEELLSLTMFLEDDEVILYKERDIFSKRPILKYSDLQSKKIIRIG